MFNLPLLMLCNTLMFSVVLNERFNKKIGMAIQGVAFVLSIIAYFSILSFVDAPSLAAPIVSGVNAVILLISSIFYSNNNLAQKITLAFIAHFNYLFSYLFLTIILGISPINFAGLGALILANLILIANILIISALLKGPFHYFSNKGISFTDIAIIFISYFTCSIANGGFSSIMGISSDTFNLYFSVLFSFYILFTYRVSYSSAKSKVKELERHMERKTALVSANVYNGLKINLDEFIRLNTETDKHLTKMLVIAEQERNTEMYNYIRINRNDMVETPLTEKFVSNQYINTILAVRYAQANELNIPINYDIFIEESKIKVLDMCLVLDNLLKIAIDETKISDNPDRYIKLSAYCEFKSVVFKATFVSLLKGEKNNILSKETLYEILESAVSDTKIPEIKNFDFLIDTVNRLDGKTETSTENDEVTIKIRINY